MIKGRADERLFFGNIKLAVRKMQRHYDRILGHQLVDAVRCEIIDMVFKVAIVLITSEPPFLNLCATSDGVIDGGIVGPDLIEI